jgi:hypothetical protein
MTKHRRTRRKSQRGGDWYNPISWFGSSESIEVAPVVNSSEPGLIDNLSNSVSGAASGAEGFLGSTFDKAKGAASGSSSWVSGLFSSGETQAPVQAPVQAVESVYNQEPQTFGGRRRSKARRGLRGGKGGLGLTYYATPVSGIKVADPTYWINGGSRRRRRRTRKTQRKKK